MRAMQIQRPACLFAVGLAAASVSAQCSSDWVRGEGFPGMNGAVNASLVWDPDGAGPLAPVLVLAGDFTIAGTTLSSRIAAWDGATWTSPFGAGLDGAVNALASYGGALVAGGEFTHADGVPAAHIAIWNGATWQALGTGLDGTVSALAVAGGSLYAAGSFTSAGGAFAAGIARWDGASWSVVGSAGLDGPVAALATDGTSVFAGGVFAHADSVAASNIARWDGAAWSALSAGVGLPGVNAMLFDAGSLYVAGGFTSVGGATRYALAKWDGSSWSSVGTGLFNRTCVRYSCTDHVIPAFALARSGANIYAATGSGIESFNGTTWTGLAGIPNYLGGTGAKRTISDFGGSTYFGGSFTFATDSGNIARLTGATWSNLGGIDGDVTAIATLNNQLIAAGTFTSIDGGAYPGIAAFDSAGWHALPTPPLTRPYGALVAGGKLYVSSQGGGIEQWDGAAWTVLNNATYLGDPLSMGFWNNHLVAGAGNLYFGGVPGDGASAVAYWDGSAWQALGEALAVYGTQSRFAVLNGSLYAAGYFGTTSNVARYQGDAWTNVGDTTQLGTANSIAVHAGALYASMYDASSSGGLVARFDGTRWVQIGDFFDVTPDAIEEVNGDLYAHGTFAAIGDAPVDGIARWDGTAWVGFDASVAGGVVSTIAGFQDQLWAGGSFTSAGSHGWAHLAAYGCAIAVPCYANCDGSTGTPALTAADFTCFLAKFRAGDAYANCDGSTGTPLLTASDFTCFLAKFRAGCP